MKTIILFFLLIIPILGDCSSVEQEERKNYITEQAIEKTTHVQTVTHNNSSIAPHSENNKKQSGSPSHKNLFKKTGKILLIVIGICAIAYLVSIAGIAMLLQGAMFVY